MIDRTQAPAAGEIEKVDLQEAVPVQLSNGIPLYYISSGKLPVVRLEVIFQSGAWYERKNGQSFFAAKMIAEGAAGHSAHEIASQFEYYGSFLEVKPGLDRVSAVVYTLSKHLRSVSQLLRDIINAPEYPEKELEIQKRIKKQSVKINREKPNMLASQKIKEALFGSEHPYGLSLSEEAIEAITADDLHDYRRTRLCAQPTIIMSGGVTETDIEVVKTTFDQLKFNANVNGNTSSPKAVSQREIFVERPKAMQSSIRLGSFIMRKADPSYSELMVLNEIFGGYFGSRLMKNIREQKGYTYGIYSSMVNLSQASMMIIGTDVNREVTEDTLAQISYEMQRLREESIPQAELEIAKNYMLGNFQASINSPFSLADKFKAVYFHELGYNFYDNFVDTVKSVSAERLKELANEYLTEDKFSKVVVGGY